MISMITVSLSKTVRCIFSTVCLVILLGILSACQPVNPLNSELGSSSSITVSVTERIQSTPTVTETVTPTPTLSTTPTPTATITIIYPTLPETERKEWIRELIKPDNECELPCWGGIIPGKTTITEADTLFIQHGFKIYPFITKKDETYHYPSNLDFLDDNVTHEVSYLDLNGMVNVNRIHTISYNAESFQKEWGDYSPQNIIARYGEPSRVWLRNSDYTPSGYELYVFYDLEGFLIRYGGSDDVIGNHDRICPTFLDRSDIDDLYLYIKNPDDPQPLESLIGEYVRYPEYFLPLEESTDLSIEQFVDLILNSHPPCFFTPIEIWP